MDRSGCIFRKPAGFFAVRQLAAFLLCACLCSAAHAACTMGQVSVNGFHPEVDHWDGGEGGSVRISGAISTYCITGTTVTLKILEADGTGKLLGSYDAVVPDVPAGGGSFDVANAVPWVSGATSITAQVAGTADPHPQAQRAAPAPVLPRGPIGAYPSPYGYGAPGYAAPGYPAPGYPAPGYPAPGYPAPGYPAPGYPAPGYAPPGYAASPYSAQGNNTPPAYPTYPSPQ